MSTTTSRARSFLPPLQVPRPRLTLVPAVASRSHRLPFVVVVIALLGAGLVGLLLLNTSMERGAYRVTSLRAQAAALSAQQQNLQLKVAALQDPQRVAARALELGMVQNPSPAFISLQTGEVLGRSEPGTAADRFDIGTRLGPSLNRLGKISSPVGGEANGAAAGVLTQAPPAPPAKQHGESSGTQAKSGRGHDTSAASQSKRR